MEINWTVKKNLNLQTALKDAEEVLKTDKKEDIMQNSSHWLKRTLNWLRRCLSKMIKTGPTAQPDAGSSSSHGEKPVEVKSLMQSLKKSKNKK